jgi:hypothetical protein
MTNLPKTKVINQAPALVLGGAQVGTRSRVDVDARR